MNTNNTSLEKSHSLERFLVDSDVDPELVSLLKKVGFEAKWAPRLKVPNDDTKYLVWAREHGYILVCHDKHRDVKTKYAFYSEMYYRGGRVIRAGAQGHSILRVLGVILAQRHKWQEYFKVDSGEAVVHPSGCHFTNAQDLFDRSNYAMRLPFEDPSIPVKERKPSRQRQRIKKKSVPIEQQELGL